MYILGISCFYHDAAICLLKDGVPVAAVDEQAFSRKKHDSSFPRHAIRWALELEGISFSICTLEFEHHRPLYNWFCENLKIHPVGNHATDTDTG